jgi:UMF1 family MFS transporter
MSTAANTARSATLAGTPAASPVGYHSWALGQCARDPYYIIIVIYVFYPYFSNVVVGDPVKGQALIGYLNAGLGVLLALTAPFLGAIADKNGRRKPWITATVVLMASGACLLWFVRPVGGLGIYPALALLFIINGAFSISEMFHNAMLPSVAPLEKVGLISGLAISYGNVGGLLLMSIVLVCFALPGTVDWGFLPAAPLLGIDQASHQHDRIVGPLTGLWMLLFTLPLLLYTPDGRASGTPMLMAARQGLQDVMATVKQLKHYSNIAWFLLARMFFFDGMVGVMTFGGIYASGTFGWGSTSLLIYGLCTSTSAMLGGYVGGRLDDSFGSGRALQVAITMCSLLLLALLSIQADSIFFLIPVSIEPVWQFPYFRTIAELTYFAANQFFAMFFVTGLASSRTMMARLSPVGKSTQFFGLYALSGTVTAFLAPLLVATTTQWFQSQRVGLGSLILLMVIGSLMLLKVREEQATVPT